jgi:6-hydroxycyclohex-1-ene-1-carbonyl-CoA dehydrogenase
VSAALYVDVLMAGHSTASRLNYMRATAWEMRTPGAPLVRSQRELPTPGADDVVIEVAGCGVCHTDLSFLYEGVPTRHPLPLILGHEIAGTVTLTGSATTHLAGRRVIVPAVIPCGRCDPCRRGRGDICKAQVFPGNDVDGGFASHLVVPGGALCVLPASVPAGPDLARLAVCADAVSTAYAAVRKSGLTKDALAIFVGAGGVGGFGIQIAHALGARVVAIDIDPERLAAVTRFGADWTLDGGGPAKELRARIREIVKAHGLPGAEWRIFETSGTRAGQETAFALLTHGAVLGIVGYHAGDVTVRLSNLMAFAARAEGTWGCPPELFPQVVDLVLSRKVTIEPFVELHAMATINDVLERLRRHELRRRPILVPEPTNAKESP